MFIINAADDKHVLEKKKREKMFRGQVTVKLFLNVRILKQTAWCAV